jgi:hypothetical protein
MNELGIDFSQMINPVPDFREGSLSTGDEVDYLLTPEEAKDLEKLRATFIQQAIEMALISMDTDEAFPLDPYSLQVVAQDFDELSPEQQAVIRGEIYTLFDLEPDDLGEAMVTYWVEEVRQYLDETYPLADRVTYDVYSVGPESELADLGVCLHVLRYEERDDAVEGWAVGPADAHVQ